MLFTMSLALQKSAFFHSVRSNAEMFYHQQKGIARDRKSKYIVRILDEMKNLL